MSGLKSNISSLLSGISSKYHSSKDYEVTVIVKQADNPTPSSAPHPHPQGRKDINLGFEDDTACILNDIPSPSKPPKIKFKRN